MQRRRGFQTLLVLTGILLNLGAGRLLAQPTIGPKTAVPANLFVDDDNAGQQDGSALHPFRTVQQAITAAKDNDVIAVAAGTYPQYLRVESKTVRLYGGYVGGTKAGYAAGTAGNFSVRDPAKNPSHLKGDFKDSIVTLYEAGSTIVDGFLVTGGGPSKQGLPDSFVGGGFYVYEGSPTISHNVIEKNQTCPPVKQEKYEKLGGGIYSSAAKITILNNFIRNNVAGRGAGIYADGPKLVIRGNSVQNNIGVSDHGGGISLFSPNAEFSYNRVEGNEIAREHGYGWGGGMIVVSKGGNYKLSHNVFTGNYAPSVGSAFFVDEGADATMDHDLVYDNACNPAGDGFVAPVYVDGADDKIGSSLIANHITIVNHTCKTAAGPGYGISVTGKSKLTLKNSVLWNNGGGGVKVDAISSATVSYTLCEKLLKGTGNLDKDPLFVNAAAHDYRLSQGSPAIGVGEPVGNGGRTNLGAYDNKALAGKGSKNSGGGKATSPNQKTPTTPQTSSPGKVDGGAKTGSGAKAPKTYLLRGTAGELPSQVGDDNTKMSEVTSNELGGTAVQIELIDSVGQGKTKVEDWTPFHSLRLDIVNKGAKELPFEFDLFHSDTKAYATRVVAPFVLKPGKNQVRIPIKGLKNTDGSAAKLSEVRRWFIASETPVMILVGDIFLEVEGGKEANDGGGVSQTSSGAKVSKTYLMRGTAGELPSQVGDDNTKMSKGTSKELGGVAVQVELIDSFGQSQTKVEDWTPFHTLRLDIVSQGTKELPFEFDLFHSETKAYATRVVAPFVLKPGKNEVRIPVKNLKNTDGSAPKLSEVRRWFVASETPVTLLIGDIFLEGEGSKEGSDGGVTATSSSEKTSKTYLLRGTAGELPSQVGDDNTKMSKSTSKELGGVAVQVELIDSFGQGQTKVEDWTPFQTLRLDIVSQGAKDLPFEFDLFHSETKAYATRVVATFILKPGKNEVRIPIKDLKNTNGSAAKLTEVRRWFVASTTPVTLHVGDIFLESSLPGGVETPLPADNLTSGDTAKLRADLQRAQPGTTIVLPPGRYGPDIYVEKLRGTKEKPIIVTAADMRNPPVFVGGTVAFHFAGCNYITLRGLKISGCTGNGINTDDAGNFAEPSIGMVFENLVIEDIGPKGTHNALKLSGLDKFAVRGCTFSGWGGSAIDMVGCHDGVVQNCRFLGKAGFSQDTGVQVKGGSERIIIKRNFFKQAGSRGVNLGGSTDLEYFRPKVRNYEAKDIEVAGNHFVGSRAPVNYASSIQCTVRHNTIVNPETWVLRILQEQPTDNFLPCQKGVFKSNLIVFDRRVQVFANIGENTKPETFSFTGNAWFCTDGNRRPKLPAQETGGIYQVDPLLENAEAPGLKLGSQNPQLLKVGAHAFKE